MADDRWLIFDIEIVQPAGMRVRRVLSDPAEAIRAWAPPQTEIDF